MLSGCLMFGGYLWNLIVPGQCERVESARSVISCFVYSLHISAWCLMCDTVVQCTKRINIISLN